MWEINVIIYTIRLVGSSSFFRLSVTIGASAHVIFSERHLASIRCAALVGGKSPRPLSSCRLGGIRVVLQSGSLVYLSIVFGLFYYLFEGLIADSPLS